MKLVVLNVDIIGIAVSMWKHHNFETTFTYDDVMNIQYSIGKGFRYRERALSMSVNVYFGPIRTNTPCATPNHGPGISKVEIYYSIQTYYFTENWLIYEESWKKEAKKYFILQNISIPTIWSLLFMTHATN